MFILEEKSSFTILGLSFSSKLNWSSYIIIFAKTAPKRIGALICSMKFLSPEISLYLYKSTIRPYLEYCCTVVMSGLVEIIDQATKTDMQDCWSFTTSPGPLVHRQNVASLSLFYRYYFGTCSSELTQLAPLPYYRGRSTRYSDRLHDFSVSHYKIL